MTDLLTPTATVFGTLNYEHAPYRVESRSTRDGFPFPRARHRYQLAHSLDQFGFPIAVVFETLESFLAHSSVTGGFL
jgi:hypothetical protein